MVFGDGRAIVLSAPNSRGVRGKLKQRSHSGVTGCEKIVLLTSDFGLRSFDSWVEYLKFHRLSN